MGGDARRHFESKNCDFTFLGFSVDQPNRTEELYVRIISTISSKCFLRFFSFASRPLGTAISSGFLLEIEKTNVVSRTVRTISFRFISKQTDEMINITVMQSRFNAYSPCYRREYGGSYYTSRKNTKARITFA